MCGFAFYVFLMFFKENIKLKEVKERQKSEGED